MSLEVLLTRSQIEDSRKRLSERGLSCLSPGWKRWLSRWGLIRGPLIGDHVKSWDVLKTAEFVEKNVEKNGAILDQGSMSSEILPILSRMGYSQLTGVDLSPENPSMPDADRIRYEISDFMKTPFKDGSFAAITSVSVIEHGYNGEGLMSEVSRLLRPGGFYIASFDYWPKKIPTDGIDMFGLSWRIFSEEEVREMLSLAEKHGLKPAGEIKFDPIEKHTIDCMDRSYTFAWMVMRKEGA